jgi:hypothetical protein
MKIGIRNPPLRRSLGARNLRKPVGQKSLELKAPMGLLIARSMMEFDQTLVHLRGFQVGRHSI